MMKQTKSEYVYLFVHCLCCSSVGCDVYKVVHCISSAQQLESKAQHNWSDSPKYYGHCLIFCKSMPFTLPFFIILLACLDLLFSPVWSNYLVMYVTKAQVC
jgi:hypothetical protein